MLGKPTASSQHFGSQPGAQGALHSTLCYLQPMTTQNNRGQGSERTPRPWDRRVIHAERDKQQGGLCLALIRRTLVPPRGIPAFLQGCLDCRFYNKLFLPENRREVGSASQTPCGAGAGAPISAAIWGAKHFLRLTPASKAFAFIAAGTW